MIARKAADGLEEAIKAAVSAVKKGAYAFVMLADKKLIGIRDPYGIRPLCIGTNEAAEIILSF